MWWFFISVLPVFYRAHGAHHLKRRALLGHIIPLFFSSLCFIVSFGILGTGDEPVPKSIQIAKIILWYGSMFIEIVSYFLSNELPGRVGHPTDGVIARSGTLFTVILGGGLDKITKGLQYIVGDTGLGVDGIGLFVSAAVIFISQFSLYFGSSGGKRKLSGNRLIIWFFAHFFYLSALIMTLQGLDIYLLISLFRKLTFSRLLGVATSLSFSVGDCAQLTHPILFKQTLLRTSTTLFKGKSQHLPLHNNSYKTTPASIWQCLIFRSLSIRSKNWDCRSLGWSKYSIRT